MISITANGNICTNIEIRQTQRGEVASFVLACRKPNKDANNEYGTDFVRVSAFGGNVQYLKQYGQKGLKALATGTLTSNTYTKKDGTLGFSLDLSASKVELLTYPQQQVETRPAYTAGYSQVAGTQSDKPTVTASGQFNGSNTIYTKDIDVDDMFVTDMNGNPVSLPF